MRTELEIHRRRPWLLICVMLLALPAIGVLLYPWPWWREAGQSLVAIVGAYLIGRSDGQVRVLLRIQYGIRHGVYVVGLMRVDRQADDGAA